MRKLISNNKIPKRELKVSNFSKVGIKSDEDKIQFDGKRLIKDESIGNIKLIESILLDAKLFIKKNRIIDKVIKKNMMIPNILLMIKIR